MPKLAAQIHPKVFQIAAPFEGGGLVNCYLIDAPRRTLIDTGTASVPQASLLPALKEMGWELADLRVIINTHLHIDHAGGNAEMQEASGAGIHIHKADADFTDREKYLEKYCRDALRLMGQEAEIPQSEAFQRQLLGREWGVERALEDGDEVDLGGDVRLHVLHTPGHTPGSASFYWESESLLFSGDAVGGRGSRAGGFPLYFSSSDYANSLRRLLDLNVATLAQAHRYRWSAPTQEAVRTGPEVRQTLEESLAVWQAIDTAVRSELGRNSNVDILTLVKQVVRATAAEFENDPEPSPIPTGTVNTVAAHWRDAKR
ncbi:MAG TPA: MBL fold metallo-hydrolase [Chloroflexota bacterium]|nr:MBL fold metallo-hydrolase [Chloroflexota bacterium]